MERQRFVNDNSLVEACINRDLEAWSILINKYSPLINGSIVNRLNKYGLKLSKEDIEDVRQGLIADIWESGKLNNIRNRDDISYWISIVSGNAAIEYVSSKNYNLPSKVVSISDDSKDIDLSEIIPSDKLTTRDILSSQEYIKIIEDAMERLPARERLILKLNLIAEQTQHDISEMLGMPKGTVACCIKRGKEQLKEILKKLQEFS